MPPAERQRQIFAGQTEELRIGGFGGALAQRFQIKLRGQLLQPRGMPRMDC